jgi:glutamate/tyrosine decarboxylase-like PLP-dependent enzyme
MDAPAPASAAVGWSSFREQGKRMVDFIADYYETLGDRDVRSGVRPGYLAAELPDSAPEAPTTLDAILADVSRVIMPGVTHWQHPRFFGYFPANSSPPGLMADMLSDAIGCVAFSWIASPAATELETLVLRWLAKLTGLPDAFMTAPGGGVIQATASDAVSV